MNLNVVVLDKHCTPYKKYKTDAGLDLFNRVGCVLLPHKTVKIPAGIKMAIPEGYVGMICPRSHAMAQGILIEGKIDPDFRGEVHLIVTNLTNEKIFVDQYQRIAQCIITKTLTETMVIVDKLDDTERGEGGFGHTGGY